MKNIKYKNIIFNKITKFNNYIIDKFNQINSLKNKFNQISKFNKFLIFFISILFSYLFYVSLPSLYDYERLQNQLKAHLLNEYNLNISISDKIQYKILPAPHFEVKDSIIYTDIHTESEKYKLAELKNLRIFIFSKYIYNQEKLSLKSLEIKESLFFLNKSNRKFISDYFNTKNFDQKILIKKSRFFLMDKEKIISIFPVKNIKFKYNEKIFNNEATINGSAFNSDFNLNLKKAFLKNESLNFDLKFPKINLSIQTELLPVSKKENKYNLFNKINFFGSEIKSEFKVNKDFLVFESKKSKIFNNQINFNGFVEFRPFYLKSDIVLDQINLIKILKNNDLIIEKLNQQNLIHKNFNSKISIDIKKFSRENIFDKAKFFFEIQNGSIKFDDTIFISEKFGFLKILSSNLYNENEKLFLKSNILIDIKNPKKFYNIFQIEKNYRIDIKKINFDFITNLTSGKTKIVNFQIDNIISKNLDKKINQIVEDNNIDINKNFNNWIVLKRFLNTIILEVNQE